MMEQNELIKNLHLEDNQEEVKYNNDDLEQLKLGILKSNVLENNPLFL